MAKTMRDEDLVLNIIVNGDKGRKEINQLDRATRDLAKEVEYLESKQKKLRSEGKKDTDQYKRITAELEKKRVALQQGNMALDNMRKNMDINRMSTRELRAEMTRLRRLATDPLNKEWQKHAARLQQVKSRYGELQARARSTQITLRSLTTTLSTMLATMAAVIATFTGLAFVIRRATDEFTGFDDKVADVMKTTGLAKASVLDLNEELRDVNVIDTRTSQEGLLGLLRIAGKLGIEGRNNLLGFTKATDQIAVSLTEDLGGDIEQSINTIGKLVGIFNTSDEFGIEDSLLKVGSTINELGASSEANEGFIVDFTKRLAGVAPGAKISIANIMGMGAALDVAGQSVEVSGTAISQIITKMFSDTEQFASVAGMEVKEFSELLENDANQAFITLLEGVRGNDDKMQDLVMRLKSLGIDGVRATNVIGVLANNVEELRSQQSLANEAFEEGTSITDEFNIKNTTAAAELEKVQKRINNLWIELGERLYPAIMEGNKLFETFLQILIHFVDFLKSNYAIIITLTAAFVGYQAVIISSTIATKAATIATRIWNATLRANPIGIVISLLAALGTAMYFYSKRTKEAVSAQQLLNEAQGKANESLESEEQKIKSLLRLARDKTISDDARRAAIKKLIEISPDYLETLSLETINTDNATEAINQYIQAKKDQIVIDQLQIKQKELLLKQDAARESIAKSQQGLQTLNESSYMNQGYGYSQAGSLKSLEYKNNIAAQEKSLSNLVREEAKIRIKIEEITQKQLNQIASKQAADDKANAEETARNRKELLDDEHKKRLESIREYREKVLLESKSLIEQERVAYRERLKLAGLHGKRVNQMSTEEFAVYEALRKQYHANIGKIDAEAISAEIQRFEAAFQSELNALKVKHNEELKSFKGTKEQREQLIRSQTRTEEALVKEQLEKLQLLVSTTLDTGSWEGITADDVLSEEEYQILKDKLEEIGLSLSAIGLKKNGQSTTEEDNEENKLSLAGSTDVLGLTQDDWALFFDNLKAGEAGIRDIIFATQALAKAYQLYDDYITNAEKRKLQQFESSTERKKDLLQNRLDSGLISQKKYNTDVARLEAELDQKKAEFEYNQAKRDRNSALFGAIVNTASGIARAYADHAFPASAIISAIVGAAGAVQIGSIATTPLPEIPGREDGGYMDVVRSQDRKLFRAKYSPKTRGYVDEPTVIAGENGREFVASNEAYNNPSIRPLLDMIDTAQRNGSISTMKIGRVLQDRDAISMMGRERGGYMKPETSNLPDGYETRVHDPMTQSFLNRQAIINLNETLKRPLKAEVSILGKGGFAEAQEDLDRLNDDVNF